MGDYRGRDAIRAFNESSGGSSLSGMRLAINDLITAGTKVIVRFTNSGAQTGPFMGVRASRKHAEWMGIGIYDVRDGKISEAWFGEDILGMLMQFGVVTLPTS